MSQRKHKSPSTKKRDMLRMMEFNLKKGAFKSETQLHIDNTEYIDMIIDTEVESKECFYASTPKKTADCQECDDKSQCVDCIIKHLLGRHVVARALFDGWPPDRLHRLL